MQGAFGSQVPSVCLAYAVLVRVRAAADPARAAPRLKVSRTMLVQAMRAKNVRVAPPFRPPVLRLRVHPGGIFCICTRMCGVPSHTWYRHTICVPGGVACGAAQGKHLTGV